MGDGTVDRRRFIGLGLVAAGSAAAIGPGSWASRATVQWDAVEGFPGRPNGLTLQAPDLPDGTEVQITVLVEGPDAEHPTVVLQSARARLEGGATWVAAPLTYPYPQRVPGEYRYVAVVDWRGATLRSAIPATYTVRTWRPLS